MRCPSRREIRRGRNPSKSSSIGGSQTAIFASPPLCRHAAGRRIVTPIGLGSFELRTLERCVWIPSCIFLVSLARDCSGGQEAFRVVFSKVGRYRWVHDICVLLRLMLLEARPPTMTKSCIRYCPVVAPMASPSVSAKEIDSGG